MKDKERIKLKDSKLFKFAKEKLPNAIGKGLEIFGDLTGKDSIENLGNWIQGQTTLTPLEEIDFNKARELDLAEMKIIEENITSRWESDNNSENKLAKTARPITLHFISLLLLSYFVMGYLKIYLPSEYTSLLIVIIPTVYGGYFALREFGKHSKNKNK
tara:strand:- start:1738 stop:2214 length:477 start_codon:yes stop_codon:yes gene_type:complete